MMIAKKNYFLVALMLMLALATASLGFSQTSGGGTSGTTSKSTSINTVNATVLAAGGGQASAVPGVVGTPGVFPGFPEHNGEWVPYWNGLFRRVCSSQMEMGRGRHDKVTVTFIQPNDGEGNESGDCISLIDWSPFNPKLFYLNDKEVMVTSAIGKENEQPEATLLSGLYNAQKTATQHHTHVSRCVAFLRELNEGVTSGFSIGSGGSGGMTPGPGTNNENMAFAGGGLIGRNKTHEANRPEFRIVCLNDGPLNAPEPPEQSGESAKANAPTPAPATQPEPKAPPVQTIRIEVVTVPGTGAQASIPSVPTTQAPTPATTTSTATANATCNLPQFTVLFGYNEANVSSEGRAKIKRVGEWLENHPACKVQVEGDASTEGSFGFNAALARRRAKAVYDILAQNGKILGQLVQFVSLSKDRATSERNPADRRVILRIVGDASGR